MQGVNILTLHYDKDLRNILYMWKGFPFQFIQGSIYFKTGPKNSPMNTRRFIKDCNMYPCLGVKGGRGFSLFVGLKHALI